VIWTNQGGLNNCVGLGHPHRLHEAIGRQSTASDLALWKGSYPLRRTFPTATKPQLGCDPFSTPLERPPLAMTGSTMFLYRSLLGTGTVVSVAEGLDLSLVWSE
jgi:hypothetical protein